MIKLSPRYYKPQCYWAHFLTLRCPARCPFCILDGRGKCQTNKEMTGKQILDFWNGLEHPKGQKLSLLGGETTMHPDIVDIVNNLEGYSITITTNCKGNFYKDENFHNKFKPHPSSKLRINTTFHPHYISADDYINIVKKYKNNKHFVQQTDFVYHPEILEHREAIDKVKKHITVRYAPYLGFYDEENGFRAPFDEGNLSPDESFHNQQAVHGQCGLKDLNVYRDMCGQYLGREVTCEHPKLVLLLSPDGTSYGCHYKLYYDIDPICNVVDGFKEPTEEHSNCRHYGFCNWCDVPRLQCKAKKTTPLVLNRFYDNEFAKRNEISHLIDEIGLNKEGVSDTRILCYATALLYSGHRHSCRVDVRGDEFFKNYLLKNGYKDSREYCGLAIAHNVDVSVIKDVSQSLCQGGVLVVAHTFDEKNKFDILELINILNQNGLEILGNVDFIESLKSINDTHYGVICFRRKL